MLWSPVCSPDLGHISDFTNLSHSTLLLMHWLWNCNRQVWHWRHLYQKSRFILSNQPFIQRFSIFWQSYEQTLIEITKCPPFFRKWWAFKATILVWSGWATSAKMTSTMPKRKGKTEYMMHDLLFHQLAGQMRWHSTGHCLWSHWKQVAWLQKTEIKRLVSK